MPVIYILIFFIAENTGHSIKAADDQSRFLQKEIVI
jgi:hypothetical protein